MSLRKHIIRDDESKVSTSDPKFATDTIPPTTPVINTRLVYKGGTLTPIDVSTDPNTQVALIDKMVVFLVQVQQIVVVM